MHQLRREVQCLMLFFEKGGNIVTMNQLNIDRETTIKFLKIGTTDLQKIRQICEQNEIQIPTEIKMYYDVKTGKYSADYKYDEVCSYKMGISSGEVFMK